jgi:prepilin-type N-terminal cleavage/methylation domain-containing protein
VRRLRGESGGANGPRERRPVSKEAADPMRRSGFTLMETLCVIAILAPVLAILAPVYSKVRKSARIQDAIANLHHIH